MDGKCMDNEGFFKKLNEEGITESGDTYSECFEYMQELKKYKDMWQWFKKNYSYYLVGVKEKQGNWTIKNFIDIAEQQYFPEPKVIKSWKVRFEELEKEFRDREGELIREIEYWKFRTYSGRNHGI